jgi:hypothetical protein
MGIFRLESAGLIVPGPCCCGRSLCARGAILAPRRFFTERALGGVGRRAWHGTAGRERILVL